MAWVYLVIAGCFEIGFTTCMKMSKDFTVGKWIVGFVICIYLSFHFLSLATRTIPMGTAYAVWTGIGAVGTVIIGMIFFNEPTYFLRVLFIFVLIGSIIGLKLVS